MLFYADEDFSAPAVKELRRLGHDVLTAQQDNRRQTPDDQILARAHALSRAVLTHNRFDFVRLHIRGAPHSGIVAAKQDAHNHIALARRIHACLSGMSIGRWCIRVNRRP
jgi:Domain of unknown function (DUF5615)